MSRLIGFLVIVAVIVFGAFFILRTPDTDPAAMAAKYGGPPSQFLDWPDGRIHYRDQGNPNGPAIILIHGTAASLHTWEGLVKLLGDDYRIITYDQPGHGLTGPSKSEDYSAHGMMAALDAVVNKTGVTHFVLGGNSMGGWVAWRYALEHPDRVDALLLIDAAGMPLREGESAPPSNIGFKLLQIKWLRPLLEQITPRGIVAQSLKQTVGDPAVVTDAMIDRYWELLRYPGNRRASALRMDVDREPAMADRVAEITAPTLILWGAKDQLIYPTAGETFHERLPHSKLIVYDGLGHIGMEEAPEKLAPDIRAFLEESLLAAPAPQEEETAP
ncbi:MAG TPA: alpha/beta hydrolase [Parvularculaceae bacterium]|nr:alpha/beta hydrolase [Parvularculaceae bacterium]